MVTKTERPLTDKEKASLRRCYTPKYLNAFFAGLFVMLPIVVVYALLCRAFPQLKEIDRSPWGAVGIVLPPVLVAGYVLAKERRRCRHNPDLAKGLAEVIRVETTRAIKVEEFEDEGIGFYLDIGAGKVLFLQGQYLYDGDEDKRFPSTQFTITRTPHARLVLELKSEGEFFSALHTNPPFTDEDFKADRVPCDGDILDADFDSLKKKSPSHRRQATV